ncbi:MULTISPECIES: tRNA (adenosine(37)-N6)-threonylcarbamoyltransferase complex dimerization subunit type 1 TsaB [Bacteria]|uniref:tRNA (adenosine(37)-N6)-threonylcarbamoyltransferase complex dimerization subunit type 1 TsaB n=1 Tax=Bacteria TaxID=2 RepID=UPI003C7CE504
MILAVDTSLGSAVAVLGTDGDALADVARPGTLGHAEAIGDLLREVLGAEDPPVTHVVAGMGPGPFTGLRIGIAAARAFALGRGIPVIGVPSHAGAALAVIEGERPAGAFAIVTDARRREAAVTVYEGVDLDGIPHAVVETVLVPRSEVESRLSGIPRHEPEILSAAALARVGRRAIAAGRELAGPEPLYLRAPDARPPVSPKRVGV